jgi:hypothetical protein
MRIIYSNNYQLGLFTLFFLLHTNCLDNRWDRCQNQWILVHIPLNAAEHEFPSLVAELISFHQCGHIIRSCFCFCNSVAKPDAMIPAGSANRPIPSMAMKAPINLPSIIPGYTSV